MHVIGASDDAEAEVFGLRGADPRLGGPATIEEIESEGSLANVAAIKEKTRKKSILEQTAEGSQGGTSFSGAWAAEEKAREEKGAREREQAAQSGEAAVETGRKAAETVAETGAGIAEGAGRTLGGAGRAIDEATDDVVAGVKRGALILGVFLLLAIGVFSASRGAGEQSVKEVAR